MSDSLRVTSNAPVLADIFRRAAVAQAPVGASLVRHYGTVLLAKVKAHAAGRPGPRIVTGDYNRSITLDVTGLTARVGTSKDQARRLEFGFHGIDSLGRRYDQPPYPHFGPAYDEVKPEFEQAVLAAVDRLLR